MRGFILNHTGWFALGWFGSVVLGTGLGAFAISLGTPVMVVVYIELALQIALTLAVAFGIPERLGGLVAVALTTVLPLGAIVAWAEVTLSRKPTSAGFIAVIGAALICLAAWRALATQEREPRRVAAHA
jgi:hypothetical protein